LTNEILIKDVLLEWNINSTLFYLISLATSIYIIGSFRLIKKSNSSILFNSFIRGLIGYLVLFLALIGPFGTFEETFWIHMVQHLLIIMIVPPLLLSGLFFSANLWFLPRVIRLGLADFVRPTSYFRKLLSKVTSPKFGMVFYIFCIWTWHLPIFFNYALDLDFVHVLEHISFMVSGILFWWPIMGLNIGAKKLSLPIRIVYLLIAVTPTVVVAALITLADGILYGENSPRLFGIDALLDQRIGGLIMWIPGNTVFLITLTILFFKWSYNQNERKYKD